MEKVFYKPSDCHGKMNTETIVKLSKDHFEINKNLPAGSCCKVNSIIHYPTRCRIIDEN